MDYSLNCHGKLLSLEKSQVMGIVNVTPDSFYANSRQQTDIAIAKRVEEIITQGGTIVDVGACSTRPDSSPVSEIEEADRLRKALMVVRRVAPSAIISVDTFRPSVARMAVEEFGADIINDVGPNLSLSSVVSQEEMFRMVARLHVPYVYMSRQASMGEILLDCARAVDHLRRYGQKDIILDPGFGFGKSLEENYKVMHQLERMQIAKLPILVGISRKSMIYRLLETNQEWALNGTVVLNTVTLLKGASILRVHDVKEAVESIKIVTQLKS